MQIKGFRLWLEPFFVSKCKILIFTVCFTYFLRRFCKFKNSPYICSALHHIRASQFANICRWPFLCQAVSFCWLQQNGLLI